MAPLYPVLGLAPAAEIPYTYPIQEWPLPSSVEQQSGIVERTLGAITGCASDWPVTLKRDLAPGDLVVVSTKNSVYRLQALGGDLFVVSGGWFERTLSPATVTVNGCTFGGSAIWSDVVAGPGLFLEFGNRVSTTRIRHVRVERQAGALAGSQSRLPN